MSYVGEIFLKVDKVVEDVTLVLQVFRNYDKVVEDVTLVLQVFRNYDTAVDDLFYCVPSSSESSLLFGQQFLGLTFLSVADDA
ncbi:hypothetical protein DPMN_023562 [Dreissena polymorpha]|uniref:Uncharacterized protein n=1 Tax=Dreissena polymorpha TaxID=45954 RepID=A0A9D4LN67_DREPO|nr:hypothetical protein DPMN_023562 [Dreissena polymorpha]